MLDPSEQPTAADYNRAAIDDLRELLYDVLQVAKVSPVLLAHSPRLARFCADMKARRERRKSELTFEQKVEGAANKAIEMIEGHLNENS